MAIRLEKDYSLDIPQQDVWDAMQDPEVLAEILPNCKSLTPLGDDEFIANIEVKIGPIKSQFKSTLSIIEKYPPDNYAFKVNGSGTKGHMSGKGSIKLTKNGTGTNLKFLAEGNVGGIIARVGQRFIEATGKKLMDQGIENFKQKLLTLESEQSTL